jgi:hypothetical protein
MMEAVRTSETSVDNHFTRQYNPEDSSEHLKLFYFRNTFHIADGICSTIVGLLGNYTRRQMSQLVTIDSLKVRARTQTKIFNTLCIYSTAPHPLKTSQDFM